MEIAIRLATDSDIEQLVEMRRDFTFEDTEQSEKVGRPEYESDCTDFLARAILDERWHIWVGEEKGRIVAHAYVALIDKVPRPTRETTKIAYLTNVYTRPAFRGQGIGAQLLEQAQQAALTSDVELMMVWPSEESGEFYRRRGFTGSEEPLIWHASPPKSPRSA